MRSIRNHGFTAIELTLSLLVMACLFAGAIIYSHSKTHVASGLSVANQSLEYSGAAVRYIKTHYSLLEELLLANGQSNGRVATIPLAILKSEDFLNKVYPEKNLLNQSPCLVITYGNNQVEGFIYYRDDKNSKNLDQNQLRAGLEHIGGMMGVYQNGDVIGAGNGWALQADDTITLFVQQGSADPSRGANPSAFKCPGSAIPNNSYVINLASQLVLNNHLPKDDSLHEYPDTQSQIDSPQNSNTLLDNLNMDYINLTDATQNKKSNIIFQLNQNCIMDPNNPASMQDYDSRFDGTNILYQNSPNDLGCRSRQLGITESIGSNGISVIRVTGFQLGGEANQYTTYNRKNPTKTIQQPYVGDLVAHSIQPIAKIAVGTVCTRLELGKMAQQYNSGDPNDVNNLYVSQVQCMKSPFCPAVTDSICYMPINSVTITGNPNMSSYECPAGMVLTEFRENHGSAPDWGYHCCQYGLFGLCLGNASAHDLTWDGIAYTYLSNISTFEYKLYSGVATGVVHYHYTCDAVCACPGGDATTWQPVITSYTCSNDISKVYIPIQQ